MSTDSFVDFLSYFVACQDSLVQIIDQNRGDLRKQLEAIEPATLFALLDRTPDEIQKRLLEVLSHEICGNFLARTGQWTRAKIFSGLEDECKETVLQSYHDHTVADEFRNDMHLFQKLQEQFPILSQVVRHTSTEGEEKDEDDSDDDETLVRKEDDE